MFALSSQIVKPPFPSPGTGPFRSPDKLEGEERSIERKIRRGWPPREKRWNIEVRKVGERCYLDPMTRHGMVCGLVRGGRGRLGGTDLLRYCALPLARPRSSVASSFGPCCSSPPHRIGIRLRRSERGGKLFQLNWRATGIGAPPAILPNYRNNVNFLSHACVHTRKVSESWLVALGNIARREMSKFRMDPEWLNNITISNEDGLVVRLFYLEISSGNCY